MTRPTSEPDTAQRILDIAARLVQTRGFNGFSYADIASELGVTKASLHYHFPTKSALGTKLIERYEHNFVAALESIERDAADEFDKLRRYAGIYDRVLSNRQMCLCGMLAAEHGTLPDSMRRELRHFFDVNETWLAGVLERGRTQGLLHFDGAAGEVARMLLGALEGAMMLARSYGDAGQFRTSAERLLAELRVPNVARAVPTGLRGSKAAHAGRKKRAPLVTAKRAA